MNGAKLPNGAPVSPSQRWENAKLRLEETKLVYEAAMREHVDARSGLLTDLGTVPMGMTGRQSQVLVLLRDRRTNKEIAQVLGIEERTVKHHVSLIMQKLCVRSRYDL